jgi:hypothetical protein
MTPDDFLSLPAPVALRILLDGSAKLKEIVENTEKPRGPLPPKYDFRLRRKNQRYVWASEASLESLTWELGRAKAEAVEGGQWADKAAKNAETLQRWVNWRTWEPVARWQGTRGDNGVHALAPSKHPTMHDWEPRGAPTTNARGGRPDYGDNAGHDDRDIRPANRGDAYEDAGEGDDVYPNF